MTPHNRTRRRLVNGLLAGAGLAASGSAMRALAASPAASPAASAFPAHPVHVVVPYPAGGVVDVAARIVTDHLGTQWRQQVVVENRPGANGNIGAGAVKAAAPDGHTLLVGSMFLVLNPLIDAQTRFATRDFAPVAALGTTPNLLVVPASGPLRTVADLVRKGRAAPGTLSTPNPGLGSSNHLGLELFLRSAGLEAVQVGYKGQPPFIQDLVSGRLDFAYVTAALALPLIEAGKLRALAVASDRRLPALAQVPTLAEAGYGDGAVLPWNGLFAPAGTPADTVQAIARAVRTALADPAVIERYRGMHAETPAASFDFNRFVATEQTRWQRVVESRQIDFAGI